MSDEINATDDALDRMLRELDDLERQRLGRRARRTRECVPPAKLTPWAARGQWTADELAHVESCGYCQRMIAIGWRVEHPASPMMIRALLRYVLDPNGAPDHKALAFHLDEDQCETCWNRLESGWFRVLVGIFKPISSHATWVVGELALVEVGGLFSREGSDERAEGQATDADSGLRVSWHVDDRKHLVAYAESRDRALIGRGVRLELVGEADSIGFQELFVDIADGTVSARHDFGPAAALLTDIDVKAVLAVLDEPATSRGPID